MRSAPSTRDLAVTKAYIFFSVHEPLFHRMAEELRAYGVDQFSGFVWGRAQEAALTNRGIAYDPLLVFTRDFLPKFKDRAADVEWLARRERELGVSIQRMLFAERHLLAGRSYDEILRMAEVALREVAAAYDRIKPDFVFSEDISCFHSYVHFVLARERGIPFWCIGSGRLPNRVAVYGSGMQRLETTEQVFRELTERGLDGEERRQAEAYVEEFRSRPRRPTGMDLRAARPGVGKTEVSTFKIAARRYLGDRDDPTSTPPHRAVWQRVRRMARVRMADALGMFDTPRPGERYIVYPIHFQPEASTLVQAPLYVDQLALITDIARSLPIGHRLYVKEHLSNRGRRPLGFYEAIRKVPGVRLLGPDVDTWELIKSAAAIAVITGTMGWEGLLYGKPVITFGNVFYNVLPHVYRASEVPKDGWFELFRRAVTEHRPDHEALLRYVAALHRASFPGFIGNPVSFPGVMEPENVAKLVQALVTTAGLGPTAAPSPSTKPAPPPPTVDGIRQPRAS